MLRLVTNGFFVQRHPTLVEVLRDDPCALIEVSVHHDAPEYLGKLRPNLELLERWVHEHGLRVLALRSHGAWTRRYHRTGADMQPYADADPRASWENCPARTGAQLHEGRIWKCAPLAYLGLQHRTHCLGSAWEPYLHYKPLAPDCTEAELGEFFDREDESTCAMCPAHPQNFALPLPLRASPFRASPRHAA